MAAQSKFKLLAIAGGLVLLFVAFLLLKSGNAASNGTVDLRSKTDPGKKGGKNAAKAGERPRLQTKIAREDFNSLSPDELERFDAAMSGFEDYLRSLEFKHSELKFHQNLDDRSVMLYELFPPGPNELKEIQGKIDELIADNGLGVKERRLFSQYAPRASSEMLIAPGKQGSLFFNIPLDSSQNIFVDRSSDHQDVEKLTGELKASGGMNADSLGSGPGGFMMVDRTEFGWRYERFQMIEEK